MVTHCCTHCNTYCSYLTAYFLFCSVFGPILLFFCARWCRDAQRRGVLRCRPYKEQPESIYYYSVLLHTGIYYAGKQAVCFREKRNESAFLHTVLLIRVLVRTAVSSACRTPPIDRCLSRGDGLSVCLHLIGKVSGTNRYCFCFRGKGTEITWNRNDFHVPAPTSAPQP